MGHLGVDFEAAGFDSEEQRRWWRQDAVTRRTVFGSWVRRLEWCLTHLGQRRSVCLQWLGGTSCCELTPRS